jgi:alginate O-acetyltransferase complex protein AlgI
MLFTSNAFYLLLVLTFIVYYIPFVRKFQLGILVFSSFVFYGFNSPKLLLLFTATLVFNSIYSYLLFFSPDRQVQKRWVTLAVISNLSVLGFFKYAGMLTNVFTSIIPVDDSDPVITFLKTVPLPIGISFYVFQGISLVVDVYRNKERPRPELENLVHPHFPTHLFRVSFFLSFFPQLVAGPIEKAHEFIPQIKPKYFRDIDWPMAIRCLIIGYFLKTVVADNLQTITYFISYPRFTYFSSPTLMMLLFAYCMQIFADFAGYSIIAQGLGYLFGYRLMLNFNFPYVARSFSELWTRWHISLSSWLREYLYVALGGNRKGVFMTYRNLFLVMVLGGLWHGAGWNFVLWGAGHGTFLMIERYLKNYIVPNPNLLINKIWQTAVVFLGFTLLLVPFHIPVFSHGIQYFVGMVTNWDGDNSVYTGLIVKTILYSLPVILFHAQYLLAPSWKQRLITPYKPILLGFMLFIILTNAGEPGAFIYFQF